MTTPSNPILCHESGAELREDSKYCSTCEATRTEIPMPECRYCSTGLNPGDSFCRECGQVVFADENLEAAVRKELENPEDPLPKAVISELTKLWLWHNPLNQENIDVHVLTFMDKGVDVGVD